MKDDKFLTQFQKEPPKEFSDALYQKINQKEPARQAGRTFSKRFAAMLATFALVTMITFAAVPSARAAALQFLREVAGFTFLETDSPFSISPEATEEEVYSFTVVSGPIEIEGEPNQGGLIIGGPDGESNAAQLTQNELETKYDVQIKTPSGLPASYTTTGDTTFYELPGLEGVGESWLGTQSWFNKNTQDVLFLIMQPAHEKVISVVGPDSVEEVQVNGQPAALLNGVWSGNSDSKETAWNSDVGLTLTWTIDGVTYELSSPTLDAATLIQIAESME